MSDWRRRPPDAPMLTGTTWHVRPAPRARATNASSARRRPGVVPSETRALSGIEPDSTEPEANLPTVPKPVASVVVPTRDRAGYLDVTIASLRDQSFSEPYEVIVVDDASRDGTRAVAEKSGVRYIAPAESRGPN